MSRVIEELTTYGTIIDTQRDETDAKRLEVVLYKGDQYVIVYVGVSRCYIYKISENQDFPFLEKIQEKN